MRDLMEIPEIAALVIAAVFLILCLIGAAHV